MSPLVLGELLKVFVNTVIAGDKYTVQDFENLQLPIPMQLSQKRKTFSRILVHFWNVHQILNIFEKRMIIIVFVFPKVQIVKVLVGPLSK